MPVEPSVPGRVRCMSCQKEFRSPDKLRIRRCPKCKKRDGELSAREMGTAGGFFPDTIRHELWRE